MKLCLHQFEFSHFNEKVRWALDYKNIAHTRQSYLPGPHKPFIKRLSGTEQTPVLEYGEKVIAGSAAIIDTLEKETPTPALYPADPELRAQALAIQARFDAELGPATRTILFCELVNEADYLCAMFARKASATKRFLYRATFPLARGMIAKANGTTDPENVKQAFNIVESALSEIETSSKDTGYIIGDAFSIADLTAASLLAPIANPRHPDMARPEPIPACVLQLLARYQNQPAIKWVGKMYESHR